MLWFGGQNSWYKSTIIALDQTKLLKSDIITGIAVKIVKTKWCNVTTKWQPSGAF